MEKGTLINIIFFGGMFLIMYFFMIRPKQKKDKEQKEFIDALSKGDMVITAGGIHGKVLSVEGNTLIMEIDRGTKMTLDKSSISSEMTKKLKT